MSGRGRGMVKYLPYRSLVEQSSYLAKVFESKKKNSRRRISNDQASKINEILTGYHGEELSITYWEGDEEKRVEERMTRMDSSGIYLGDVHVSFDAIQDIERKQPSFDDCPLFDDNFDY